MTLLWVDGFEQYGASGNDCTVNSLETVYGVEASLYPASYEIVAGRSGSGNSLLLKVSQLTEMLTPALTTCTTVVAGVAFLVTNNGNVTSDVLTFRTGSTDGTTVGYDSLDVFTINGNIGINRLGTTLNITTSNDVISANTWYYLETKVYHNSASGTVEVKLDGNTVLTYSGNTIYSTAYPNYPMVGFRGVTANGWLYIDDFYVCDTVGSTCNDFLGDCVVQTLYPDADVSGNMTPSTGSDLYAMVNTETINVDTYISDTATGNQAMFSYPALPVVPNTVYGVQVTTASMLSGNLMKGVKHISQNGVGSVNTHSTNPVWALKPNSMSDCFELDPDGNAWSPATINGIRYGVEVG